MNSRFNLYTRTEEEKTKDMILYEKKAKANDICTRYEDIRKKASLVSFICTVVYICAAIPFFYAAYDKESFFGMGAVAAFAVIVCFASKIIVGTIKLHSPVVYIMLSSLCKKYTEIRGEMHVLEEKFLNQTVFEADLKETEEKLIFHCEKLIAFADSHNIEYDI